MTHGAESDWVVSIHDMIEGEYHTLDAAEEEIQR